MTIKKKKKKKGVEFICVSERSLWKRGREPITIWTQSTHTKSYFSANEVWKQRDQ